MGAGADLDTGAVAGVIFHRYRFSHCCVQGGACPSRLSTIVEGKLIQRWCGSSLVQPDSASQCDWLTHNSGWISRTVCGDCRRYPGGLALGYLSAGLFVRSDDPLSSILLTVAVALEFEIGHFLHVSGVVAVVVAGLIVGNTGFLAVYRLLLD